MIKQKNNYALNFDFVLKKEVQQQNFYLTDFISQHLQVLSKCLFFFLRQPDTFFKLVC